jgi:spermidine synthase
MIKSKLWFFLGLSFLEGGSVMAAELLGAKMMAPYFGSSLYVWSAVMAVTLFGLAAGYFVGGILSERSNKEKILYTVLVIAATFTAAMPYISKIVFLIFGQMSLQWSVTISSLFILFPPVFMMGTVSPLIISNISTFFNAGKASGIVYAISTLGGILSTFIFGFYIIPEFGLTWPAFITGFILGIIPVVVLFKNRFSGTATFFLLVLSYGIYRQSLPDNRGVVKVIYESDGILGQIVILDYPKNYYENNPSKKNDVVRWLFVNRISQTMEDLSLPESSSKEKYFSYVYYINKIVDTFPQHRKDVLILGLGGGSIAKNLKIRGFNVEVCELDSRMEFVAKKYFGLPENIKVTIDDARHFINTSNKKYDVIIFDTFRGEETPSHIITSESLDKVKTILDDKGVMIVNSFGYLDGELGLGSRSIYKTILNSGMNAFIWPTPGDENNRNLEFVAIKDLNHRWENKEFITLSEVDLNDAEILRDEFPRYEVLNAAAAIQWRKNAIEVFNSDAAQSVIPIFD